MSDLTDFLLARVAEDETVARLAMADDGGTAEGLANQFAYLTGQQKPAFGVPLARLVVRFAVPARVLAECAAKRAIVDDHEMIRTYPRDGRRLLDCTACIDVEPAARGGCHTLRALAAVYADHPDYDPDWKV